MKALVCGLAVVGSLLVVDSARATVWQWDDIFLDGLQEVAPNASPGTGLGTATLDDATGEMNISGSYSGLAGSVTLSHLHGPGGPGVNSGVIFGLTNTFGHNGTFTGSSTLDATQMGWVLDGLTYINLHSDLFAGGEIRGQLGALPEPTSLTLAAAGLIALLVARRRCRGLV